LHRRRTAVSFHPFRTAFILTEEENIMKLLTVVFTAALLAQPGSGALAQMNHGSGQGMSDTGHKMAGIMVSHGWARATAKTARTGVAYVTLENTSGTADKLISASAPVADKVELHTHMHDGAIMRMREVQSVEVGPHAKVALKPGGLHIMMIGLKEPLKKGSHFPLTLDFEKAGKMTVDVAIEGPGSMGMEGMKMEGQSHGDMKH
jgi:periplasmic copper chaperone A